MTKKICTCNICNGTGEVEGVPGEFGYEPIYEECPDCKGACYIEVESMPSMEDNGLRRILEV